MSVVEDRAAAPPAAVQPETAARQFLALAGVWLVLDQVTKAWVNASGPRGSILHTILPSWFQISHSRNTGAAFGMLGGHPAGRWLFALVAVVALAVLVAYRRQVWRLPAPQRVGLALVAAGAAGNLVDRLCRGGEVIDFIRIYLPRGGGNRYSFPDFNVADIGVTCGMALYLIHTVYTDWQLSRAAGVEAEAEPPAAPAVPPAAPR
ncbi:MAG TPA: signal peptidase II [Armatimonadetes bacterium]|nr:signal peptidase II [Armatimonadota bacterium]